MSPTDKLTELAKTALTRHKTIDKALPSFADAVWRDKQLVRLVLLPYLEREARRQVDRKVHVKQHMRAEPGTAHKLSVEREVMTTTVQAFMDSCRTADGRRWSTILVSDLAAMTKDGGLACGLLKWLGDDVKKHHNATIRDVVPDSVFRQIYNRTKKVEVAA